MDIVVPKPPPTRGTAGPSAETLAFWDKFFTDHPTLDIDFQLILNHFRGKKKFQDVEAAALGYLSHMPKGARAQDWMYGALAIAIEVNKGDPKRIKEALGQQAILAKAGGNVNFILTAADALFLRGYYRFTVTVDGKTREVDVGSLIDMVARRVPHRPQPLLMSMNLARKTLDPKRMAEAIEGLYSLGWPGMDDVLRAEARRQAEELADALKDEKRDDEADDLLARLPSASSRDLVLRLRWVGDADLDLIVEEPLGATARHDMTRTVFGGALVLNGRGKNPLEIYTCPRAFDGDYTARVEVIYQDPEKPPITSATLEVITREGTRSEHKEIRKVSLPRPSIVPVREKDGKVKNLASADTLKSAPIVVHLEGGRRKTVLPYIATEPLAFDPERDDIGAAIPPQQTKAAHPPTTPTVAPKSPSTRPPSQPAPKPKGRAGATP